MLSGRILNQLLGIKNWNLIEDRREDGMSDRGSIWAVAPTLLSDSLKITSSDKIPSFEL